MSKKIDRLINRRVLKSLLREQQDNTGATNDGSDIDMSDYKKLGFKDVDSNPKALEIENPGSENTKQIFKNSNLPERPLPDNPYYISKDYFEELIKTNKLGKSAKDLGLKLNKTELTSGDTGIKTYRKLSDNEYKIISSPFPVGVGETFNLKYEFTNEELAKLPKDLNKEKGNMFREWVNDNKTKDEIKDALEPIPSLDKTLGKSGSFTNDHFRMAYITFKDEYDKHLKKFGTDNAPAFMGLKKAETGEGVDKDYFKFVIDDVAVAIDVDGNILQRPRGKGGSYVNERKARILNRYQLLRERRLDVSYIVDKLQKGIESGNIKGMKKIPQDLKDIVKKKAGTVKPKSNKAGQKIKIPSVGTTTQSDPNLIKKANSGLASKIKKAGGGKFTAKQALKSASQYEDVSKELQVFIKGGEGYRSQIYDDKGGEPISDYNQADGTPTIGIGHAIFKSERSKYADYLVGGSKKMGKNEALALFKKDVAKHTRVFKRELEAPITHNMFVALASYCFNAGPGALNKYKNSEGLSITQLINNRRYKEAARVIDLEPRTGKGIGYMAGLEKRRHEESKLFLLGFGDASKEGEKKNLDQQQNLPYVYIADSQGKSGLGLAIRKRLGSTQDGVNFFQKNGATPAGIMSEFGDSINDAVSKTKNIIFTLGGNGSSRASFLARDVLLNAPESAQITWILAPPAVKPTDKTTYVNTPGKPHREVNAFKATRAKYNRDIVDGIRAVEGKLGMSGRINIIDPYPWFEQNVSSSGDGVHVDKKPGEEYVATIQSEIMPKSTMAENTYKTNKGKMVVTESQLRNIVKKVLFEATAKFDDYIKDRESGNDFRSWANKNHSDVTTRLDLDSKGSHTNTYIKNAWDELGDEYVKAKEVEEKEKKAAEKKKKNLSTGGKFRFLKGSNSDGTYPAQPERGLDKPFLKFVQDTQVFALDPETGDLKQTKRGEKEFINESSYKLFKKIVGVRLVENYVNPIRVYKALQRGDVEDPAGVFKKNRARITKVSDKAIEKLTKVYHPLPAPHHENVGTVAGDKGRGTYAHGGRDYPVPVGTNVHCIAPGKVITVNFGGDKFKKYYKFWRGNKEKQKVIDAFPGKQLQTFRSGTFAPIDLTCSKLPGKYKTNWLDLSQKVVNGTHFFGTAGNYVVVEHDIDGKKYFSKYMHLEKISVTKGQKIKGGDVLGLSGNTGKSTGPHLHFEIHFGALKQGNKNESAYKEFLKDAAIPGGSQQKEKEEKPALAESKNKKRRLMRRRNIYR